VGYGWIALLTDYGQRDGFVAACHGVIAQIAPAVRVIDVTHEVPPQDVRYGAAVLAQTVPYLPPAVIIGVVDPGVGTGRRGIAISAGESVLVGPDNGLLCWAADALGGVVTAVALNADAYLRRTRALTFDGRDVFAPAAAHLAAGVSLSELGPAIGDLVRLAQPRLDVRDGRLTAEALTVDHFGNVTLAATESDLVRAGLSSAQVVLEAGQRSRLVAVGRAFGDVATGRTVLYVDSSERVAIAINGGHAASALGLRPGDQVTLTRPAT
jgi:S-adenosylmethionine hydrolase